MTHNPRDAVDYKPQTGAQRQRALIKRKQLAGLVFIKIPVHPDDVESVRKYASEQPLTQAARKAALL